MRAHAMACLVERSNLLKNPHSQTYLDCFGIPSHLPNLLIPRNDENKMAHHDVSRIPPIPLIPLFLLLLLLPLSSQATIHTVKQDGTGDHTTIQAGINAAVTGDTVLAWPGTYFENIDYNSKSITVSSLYLTTLDESYIHSTIIDGNMIDAAVKIIDCIDEITTFCGFTVQHGFGTTNYDVGGGIVVKSSTCKIENCIFKYNKGHAGGGILCKSNSHVKLSGTVVKENHAVKAGGGISILGGSVVEFDTINLNSIFLNYAGQGCDIYKAIPDLPLNVVLDTFTVQSPDLFFVYSINNSGPPLYDIAIDIQNHKITPIQSNLYVDPELGDNNNSGLSWDEPMKNIYHALITIQPDSINGRNIFLKNGVYSWLASSELFMLNCRSYVNIIGESAENTILNGNYLTPLIKSNISTEHLSIKNITLTRANGSSFVGVNAPIRIRGTDHIIFDSVIIKKNIEQYRSGFEIDNSGDLILKNSIIQENYGESPISIYNGTGEFKRFRIENCKYIDNKPDSNLIQPGTITMGILGDWNIPGLFEGEIINTLIVNNTCIPDPEWGTSCGNGVSLFNYVKIDLINLTVGNNIAMTDESAIYNATNNAEGNIYNTIFYDDDPCEICYSSASEVYPPGTTNILYSDIEGGESGIINPNNYQNINWLDGNIDEDPLWVGGGEPFFSYELQPESPCINTGVPMYEAGMDYPYIKEEEGKYVLYMLEGDTVTLPATDLAGNPRISGGRIDMGAYEWQDTTTVSSEFEVQALEFSVFPNPFKSNTFIRFSTFDECYVNIEVMDMSGMRIRTIADNKFPKGDYRLVWDGKDDDKNRVKPATYLMCLLLNGEPVECKKISNIK
ncbi:MAG: hypothetical protein K9G76_09165 [Bacteroidales bacterium]|nr:hypothetical protein [Bacteroidales bacterium]